MNEVETYWFKYLASVNLPENTPFAGEFTFGCNEQMSSGLLALVLLGTKRATCTALESFRIDNEPLPKKGARYVLVDWNGKPHGVIETTNVTILPFCDVTWEMAQKEGEDDNLESWKANHDEFFAEDSDSMGYQVSPEMPVVFEEFKLLYKDA